MEKEWEFMNATLVDELKNQNMLSEFFSYNNNREFIPQPDESTLLNDLNKISDSLSMKEGLIIGCFDYRDMSLPFFTENIEAISGHSSKFIRANGLAGVISALHPDDAIEHVVFNNIVLELFQKASISEKKTFEMSYTLRWLHKVSKKEIWFYTKAKPYLIDEKGNYVFDLHIGLQVTNNGHLKGYDWSISYLMDDGSKFFLEKNEPLQQNIILTKKEKEVVKWMQQGLDSQQIAEKMFISRSTVFSHRKKMLKKLKAKNSMELLKMLVSTKID